MPTVDVKKTVHRNYSKLFEIYQTFLKLQNIIEIYVFSSKTNWIEYESIQSDIFDHLLAIAAEFNLKVFQNPTGNDFRNV